MTRGQFFQAYKWPIVVLTIALFKLVSHGTVHLQLPSKVQDFVTLSLSVFVEAFPFLILGSLLAAAVTVFVPKGFFESRLPKNSLPRRFSLSFLGFLFPVCECGNVPLSRSLLLQGLRPSEAVTFLLAAPVLNPITIWSTWSAFSSDSKIVVARILSTLVIANAIGYIVAQHPKESELLTSSFARVCLDHNVRKNSTFTRSARLIQFSDAFRHEAAIMMKMLAFGALVAGIVQSFIPRELLIGIGSNPVLSIVTMLSLAFVVSICANVDAFFALSFATTFTPGSIVSFLVFGPMIDIKMLALLKTTFRTEFLVAVTLLALFMSGMAGLVVAYAF